MPALIHKIEENNVSENPTKKAKLNLKNNSNILCKNRHINVNELAVPKHPLNIKPLGNIILAKDDELAKIGKSAGLLFQKLSDELILKIFGLLDKNDLINCSKVSKFWYAFSTFDDLWRSLYTKSTVEERKLKNLEFDKWNGSWKSSILRNDSCNKESNIDCSFIYSDALFISYSNSCIDYNDLFKDIVKEQKQLKEVEGYLDAKNLINPNYYPYRGRIPRIEESTFTYEMFENNHWNDHPFILGNSNSIENDKRWPKWTTKYLLDKFPETVFRQESVLWNLKLFESYSISNKDENPLYLFDCRSDAMKSLLNNGYFEKSPIFAEKDLFKIFNKCRPDHSWLISGADRSGSTFHKDPNSTDAWNVVLEGAKLWIMLPPEMKPPGVFVSNDESEVISPFGLAEWVKSGFWNDSIQISDEANLDTNNHYGPGGFRTCVIGITFENECMYVPSGWWHAVINLGNTVAFTANFVPPCKIGKVLNFMKNKPDQISGFRHDLFQNMIRDFLIDKKIDNDRLEILKKYSEMKKFENNDEDVGELKETGCMPVFEAFIELLLKNGYNDLIDKGLSELVDDKIPEVKKSHAWEELTQEGKNETKGFSFGFDVDTE